MEVEQVLLGEETFSFLFEVAIRTAIMFLAVIAAISLLGKRGVKQLSVFELVIIISMGSAAGDPMFYKDVGILPALLVFTIIILIYKGIMYLLNRSERFEKLIEGKPVYLIRGGAFCYKSFEKEALAVDEFFAELRQYNISQLGQIRIAIIEPTGNISLFYYEDKDVIYGLPILPDDYEQCATVLEEAGHYSCRYCGHTEYSEPRKHFTCPVCERDKWVRSSKDLRIT
jgi:uncharacterized membrane protein YcaP (DUF421 family)